MLLTVGVLRCDHPLRLLARLKAGVQRHQRLAASELEVLER